VRPPIKCADKTRQVAGCWTSWSQSRWHSKNSGYLSLYQRVSDKDEPTDLGQSKEKSHKQHQQHVGAGQEGCDGVSKGKRSLSMRHFRKGQ
jgi:hypothetical protein